MCWWAFTSRTSQIVDCNLGAGLVGTLAAISFGAELLGAVPLGMLSDALSARTMMTSGALLAALATLLFGVTQDVSLFVVSRAIEGLAAAAGVPALLAYLTDATADDPRLRARAMSYFELSLLAGLALGGILGSRLWTGFHTGAFAVLALLYGVAALLLFVGSVGRVAHRETGAWRGLVRALATPQLRRLAPVWICMNAIIGLWLGPTLYFLLTNRSDGSQMLTGLLADDPSGLGMLLFVYAAGLWRGRPCMEPCPASHRPETRSSRVVDRDAGGLSELVAAQPHGQPIDVASLDPHWDHRGSHHDREWLHPRRTIAAGRRGG